MTKQNINNRPVKDILDFIDEIEALPEHEIENFFSRKFNCAKKQIVRNLGPKILEYPKFYKVVKNFAIKWQSNWKDLFPEGQGGEVTLYEIIREIESKRDAK